MPDEDAARTLVRRWYDEVWRDGRLDAIEELLADPFIRHTAAGTDVTTPAAYRKRMAGFQRTLHGATTTFDDQVVRGDMVWTRATSRGLNRETGERALMTWLVVFRVAGGRLAEMWVAAVPDVDWTT